MKLSTRFSGRLTPEQADFLDRLFQNCPDYLASHTILKSYRSKQTLISTDDTCAHVYILLKGKVQAIEERVTDADYCFTVLSAFELIGDFELFSNSNSRLVTITTLQPCLCLILPATSYLEWIRSDSNALFIRIQMLIKQLSAQAHAERQVFFLNNRERLLHFFNTECSLCSREDSYQIAATHQDIATRIGCSLRTVNRLITQLHQEHYISLVHGKIQISPSQRVLIRDASMKSI